MDLNEKELKNFLSDRIRVWTTRQKKAVTGEAKVAARAFIDAYQAVAFNFLGQPLDVEQPSEIRDAGQ